MTTTSKTADGTTITIENYSDFQGTRTTSKTTSDTTNGTTDRARTRNKEKKNEKNAPGARKNAPGASKKIEPPMGDPIF
jgi:ribosome assembly protein YihI (activator of Der GTPase)